MSSPGPGANFYTYTEHTNWIYAVAWSPDSTRIASAGRDGTIRTWDAMTGGRVVKYRENVDCIYSLAWTVSENEQYIASANDDRTVRIRNINSGEELSCQGHQMPVKAVAWSPPGKTLQLASAGTDATVRIWTIGGEQIPPPYEGHTQSGFLQKAVNAVTWSPDGKWIASAGDDNRVWIWKVDTEGEVAIPIEHKHTITAVAWSPNGKKLAFASRKEVRLYDVNTTKSGTAILGTAKPFCYDEHASWVRVVAWSPDGRYIVSAGDDKKVHVWNA